MDSKPSTPKRKRGNANIDPVAVLKRKKYESQSDANASLCLLCQNKTKKGLRRTDDGQKRLLKVATEWKMLHDVEWADATKKLLSILENDSEDLVLQYHADCYSAFSDAKSPKTLISNKNPYNEPSNAPTEHQAQSR